MPSACSVLLCLAFLHSSVVFAQASSNGVCGKDITVDFSSTADGSPLAKGTRINKNIAFPGGVTFKARRSYKIRFNRAFTDGMIFDTTDPSGGDADLAQFPEQGNILIISEDNDSSDPDDFARGGQIMAEFEEPMMVKSIRFIDIEYEDGSVELFDSTGATIKTLSVPYTGDGGSAVLYFGAEEEVLVSAIRITLTGSGGIDDVVFRPKCEDGDNDSELPDHCEQRAPLTHSMTFKKMQSPPGPRRSQDVIFSPGNITAGTSIGLAYFSNDIVSLETGEFMGVASGHCVQVYTFKEFLCYFNFVIQTEEASGMIAAHAHGIFDLFNPAPNMPFANLIITGGTGDFLGVVGHACTTIPSGPEDDRGNLIYNFQYEFLEKEQ